MQRTTKNIPEKCQQQSPPHLVSHRKDLWVFNRAGRVPEDTAGTVPALRGGQVTYCHTQLPARLPACMATGYWPVADTQARCLVPPPYRGFLGRIRVHSVPRLPHHLLAVGENLKSRRENALKERL